MHGGQPLVECRGKLYLTARWDLGTDSEGARWIELAQDHVHCCVFGISGVEASVSATASFFDDDLKVFVCYEATVLSNTKAASVSAVSTSGAPPGL
jgi:hypothetical protein